MAILFFDNPQGVLLVNGKICEDNSVCVAKRFSLEYFPFDSLLQPVFCAVDEKAPFFDDVIFIRHKRDYIVRFCPQKKCKNAQSEIYFQKVLEPSGGKPHCLTCHKEEKHKISIETQSELTTFELPCRATNVNFSCHAISSGQLLSVLATLENGKTYAAVLHYGDDYTLLLNLCCDEICADENGLTVCDDLCDTLNRRCVRKLKYCSDGFLEESRHFENTCHHTYIDEVVPYILLESICYGDKDCICNCFCPALRNCDAREIFGDFIGICDCLDYKPFEVTLLYSDCDGLYTKTFCFTVSSGKIHKVKCL